MKSISSLFLIFAVIYTTIGVHINSHHCEKTNITDYSIFNTENCCSKSEKSCPLLQKENHCCSDQINLVHLGQDIHFSPNETTPNQILDGFLFHGFPFKNTLSNRQISKKTKGRSPPILFQLENRQALHQVYII